MTVKPIQSKKVLQSYMMQTSACSACLALVKVPLPASQVWSMLILSQCSSILAYTQACSGTPLIVYMSILQVHAVCAFWHIQHRDAAITE